MATMESDKAYSPPLTLSPARIASPTRNGSLFSGRQAKPTSSPSIRSYRSGAAIDRETAIRESTATPFQALLCVHAGGHPVAVIGPDGGRASGESRQHESDTQYDKKNSSHSLFGLSLIRKSLAECVSRAQLLAQMLKPKNALLTLAG